MNGERPMSIPMRMSRPTDKIVAIGREKEEFCLKTIAPHLSIIKVCWQIDGEEYATGRTSQNVCVWVD